MTQERGKLEPCPFCGGEAIRQDLTDDDNAGGSCIACDQCGASSPVHFDRKENLYDSWNRRSTSSAERAMREALEKISAEQWKDRSTVSELNAWPAFQRLNRHVVELYAIADAALTTKEEK